jgi:hypothetical protein
MPRVPRWIFHFFLMKRVQVRIVIQILYTFFIGWALALANTHILIRGQPVVPESVSMLKKNPAVPFNLIAIIVLFCHSVILARPKVTVWVSWLRIIRVPILLVSIFYFREKITQWGQLVGMRR